MPLASLVISNTYYYSPGVTFNLDNASEITEHYVYVIISLQQHEQYADNVATCSFIYAKRSLKKRDTFLPLELVVPTWTLGV